MTYSGNYWLTLEQKQVNAQYIYAYLLNEGWTANAICGVLGNMESESGINSGIWQGLDEGNLSGGYGLVQWTPATKYLDWCTANNLTPSAMNSNLLRILYEVVNHLQWYNSTMTFEQFTHSTDPPYNLAMKFLRYYERPANPNQPQRGTSANYWYGYLTNSTPPPDNENPPRTLRKTRMKSWLYLKRRRLLY